MANTNRKIPFLPTLGVVFDWVRLREFLAKVKYYIERSIRTDELVMLGIESLDTDLTPFGGKGALVAKNFVLVTDAEGNAHLVGASISQTDMETILGSNKTGSATPWPLAIFVNGARTLRFEIDGGLVGYDGTGTAATGGSQGVSTINIRGGYYVDGVAALTSDGAFLPVVAYASLPASPVAGQLIGISDSNTGTFGATISGSGANAGLAYYDGTNWTFR